MYLKRLELHGFKSFAKKTVLEFNDGINGVVGPNGSGKSNISDAITWVLGEQSSKNLRGAKMDDVIFNGTEHRRPMSYAEVSLVLDNEDKKINSEYNEIYVTRKIYRNGETDYLINNKHCRLKDIYELFMDTGIGKDGYSIIGQGRIDKIINSKPEERRSIFEEAVGIVKYRTRKTEALAKLKKEKENLDRVTDIIGEIENQLQPLFEQSEVAKKYLVLEDRLRVVSISSFKKTLVENEELIKQYETDIESLDKEKAIAENEILKLGLLQHSFETRKTSIAEDIQNKSNDISDTRVQIEKEKNNIILNNEKIKNIQSNVARIKTEINDNKQNIVNFESEIKNIESEIYNNKLLITQKNSNLLAIATERNLLNAQFDKSKGKNLDLENQIIENNETVSRVSLELNDKKTRLELLEEKVSSLKVESEEKAKELHSLVIQLEEIYTSLGIVTDEIEVLNSKVTESKKLLTSKNVQLTNLKDEYNSNEREYNNFKNKLQILNDLENENQGLYDSVKYVLKNKDLIDNSLEVVANIVKVPKNLEIALEVALGASLNYIVTKDTDTASKGIELLKQRKKGRATFLPLSKVTGRYVKSNFTSQGILGVASDLIEFDEKYKAVIENLLGNILIVDTLKNAVKINENNKTHRIVTLEGDVLNTSGFMTGGSIKQSGAKIFSRKREIEENQEKLIDLKEQMKFLADDIEVLSNEVKDITTSLEIDSSSLSEKTIQKADLSNKKVMFEERKAPLQLAVQNGEEVEKNLNTLESLKSEILKLEKSFESLNIIKNNLKAEKDSHNVDVGDIQTKRDELIEKNNNVNMEISNLQNANNHALIQKERLESEIENCGSKIENLKAEIEEYTLNIDNINKEIEEIKTGISQLEVKNEEVQVEIYQKNIEIENLQKEVNDLVKKIENVKHSDSNIEKSKYTLELKLSQLHERVSEKYSELWDKYEMSHNDILIFEALTTELDLLKREERDLSQKIRALGNVNVNAIEQYSETNERYLFLTNQKDDIIKTEEQLIEIIQELTKQMETQFRQEFEIINNNFTRVFRELFNGGTAKLQLTNTENLMETGVEIIAEPPGKKLKNLMLLSGGEKAMTAIALLFAILNYKPSPFCVLDEIDSALDDANIDRYAEFLNTHSNDTQFIVITHRKGTMERAEVLYGVTMQEHGVSSLVSAEF